MNESTENLSQCEHLTEKAAALDNPSSSYRSSTACGVQTAAARQCARKKRPFSRLSSGRSKGTEESLAPTKTLFYPMSCVFRFAG